ncbi:hypothetical protein ACFSTC_48940 [Nonomuraea ferruginea]
MPFLFPWSEAAPAERAHSTIQYHFRQWGELSPSQVVAGLRGGLRGPDRRHAGAG